MQYSYIHKVYIYVHVTFKQTLEENISDYKTCSIHVLHKVYIYVHVTFKQTLEENISDYKTCSIHVLHKVYIYVHVTFKRSTFCCRRGSFPVLSIIVHCLQVRNAVPLYDILHS